MGYVDENLTAGEVVVHRTRLHSIVLFWPIVLGVLLGLPSITGLFVAASMMRDKTADSAPAGQAAFVTYLVMVGIAVLALTLGILRRSATEMAVTNKRVIAKTGVFNRRTTELLLQKVESVGVDQGVLGRMAGYGNIVVKGTGGTAERFKSVENPLEFRHSVQEQIERAHGEVRGAATERPLSASPASHAGKFCAHCGAPLSDEGQFCSGCGSRRGI